MESKVAKFEVFVHPKLFIFSPCISSRNFKLGLFGLYQIYVNILISYGWDFTIVTDVFPHEYVMIKTHTSPNHNGRLHICYQILDFTI
jgi:hypothetical protein